MFLGTMQEVSFSPAPTTNGWAELRQQHVRARRPLAAARGKEPSMVPA